MAAEAALKVSPETIQKQSTASSPHHSAWVMANAGTGKTKILIDRILRLLLSGAKPESIICLTFTNVAAGEIKNRIFKELHGWIIQSEADVIASVQKLNDTTITPEDVSKLRALAVGIIDQPHKLTIHTIHSFCQQLLGRFPLEANISPDFTLLTDQEAKSILQRSWRNLLHEMKEGSELEQSVAYVSGAMAQSSLQQLIDEAISKRHNFISLIRNHDAKSRHRYICDVFGISPEDSEENIIQQLGTCSNTEKLRSIATTMLDGSSNEQKTAPHILSWLDGSHTDLWSYLTKVWLTAKFEPRAKIIYSTTQKKLPDAEAFLEKEQQRICQLFEHLKAIRTATLTQHFYTLAAALFDSFEAHKEAENVLDFDDLLERSISLLHDPALSAWITYKLDQRYDHILVDEAQDTSLLQWSIVNVLCEEFFSGEGQKDVVRTLFVVGDEKQSIFRFQGAAPEALERMRNHFTAIAEQVTHPLPSIPLEHSFRSSHFVLKTVDLVCGKDAVIKNLTSIEANINHPTQIESDFGKVVLWPPADSEKFEHTPWEIVTDYPEVSDPMALNAKWIAATIKQWLDEGRMLPRFNRKISAGDILVLSKRRNEFVQHLTRELNLLGIPNAGLDRLKLTDHLAVKDLLAIIDFTLLPEDDYTLACILKSPLFNLTDEDLIPLCHNREGSLWNALQQHDHTSVGLLESWLDARHTYSSPYAFLQYILEEQASWSAFYSRSNKDEIDDVLQALLDTALKFETNEIADLQLFSEWIKSQPPEIKRDMDNRNDAVRIMTVHGSKGLEAPVVFLADTCDVRNRTDRLCWLKHGDDTLCIAPPNSDLSPQIVKTAKAQEAEAIYSEYLRLLYVAMTRAKEELYVTGWGKPDKTSWYSLIKETMEEHATELPFNHDEQLSTLAFGHLEEYYSADETTLVETDLPPLPECLLSKVDIPTSISEGFKAATELAHDKPTEPFAAEARQRGTLIHTLLELLIKTPKAVREAKAMQILKQHGAEDNAAVIPKVLAALDNPEFVALHGEHFKTEVTVLGFDGAEKVTGQIDWLGIDHQQKVLHIVDYKSDKSPPKAGSSNLESYLKQLDIYSTLLGEAYPDFQRKTYLFWIETNHLMSIDDIKYKAAG